jgi:hypothetical protein
MSARTSYDQDFCVNSPIGQKPLKVYTYQTIKPSNAIMGAGRLKGWCGELLFYFYGMITRAADKCSTLTHLKLHTIGCCIFTLCNLKVWANQAVLQWPQRFVCLTVSDDPQ